MKKFLRSSLRIFTAVALGGLGILASCQSKFIYFPRPYHPGTVAAWQQQYKGEIIDYQTSQGKQQAYFQRKVRQEGPPKRIWIVGAGNGTLALDLADWFWKNGGVDDAFLMIDYPGYGACEGAPMPGRIKDNVLAAVPAMEKKLGFTHDQIQPRYRIFGHSLGCAAMLGSAKELGIHRGVLISPFTSTMAMTKQVLGVNLGFLLWHRFDNAARLKELDGTDSKFIVFHGKNDEVIPAEMSRELKTKLPALIELHEVDHGLHNNLLDLAEDQIVRAMKELN